MRFMETIYHIAQKDEWARARLTGKYWPSTPANCPFIHFSFGHQVLEVANFLFAGRHDMVLLEVDRGRVEKDLKVEASSPEYQEKYPHLYRKLSVDEVSREIAFLPSSNGGFDQFPFG